MAKDKVYQAALREVDDKRVQSILGGDLISWGCSVWVVAPSRSAACDLVIESGLKARLSERDMSVANQDYPAYMALMTAGLFDMPRTVIVAPSGVNSDVDVPVVLMAEEDTTTIGALRRENLSLQTFLPLEARYARKGSVAVGPDDVLINTGLSHDHRWAGTQGISWSDKRLQRQLDLGEYEIVRAGYGRWRTSLNDVWVR